jgi:hypothetical protein
MLDEDLVTVRLDVEDLALELVLLGRRSATAGGCCYCDDHHGTY